VVRVASFDLLGTEDAKARFRVVCSSGTYVRCLASDLGGALGWGAHLSELRRTRVGRFVVGDALPLSDVARLSPRELIEKRLVPAARAVDFLPSVVLDGEGIRSLCNGGSVSGDAILKWDVLKGGESLRVLDEAGALRAIGTSKGRESDGKPDSISPVRVLVD
jgi:tRNA pseudouridine55 synthase